MANIRSFPNNQDEYIGAEDVMRWLHGRSSGVFGADGNAAVAPVLDTMAVTVSDGNGWISNDNADGVVWWIDNEKASGAKLQLSVDMADAVLPRIDRVVVSWQTTNYVALPEVKILKGTAASNPVAPELTNNNILRQISLAAIYIPAGSTAITSVMITDERLNPEVCGIVSDRVTADTSMVNAQYLEAVEELRTAIQQAWNGEIPNGSITQEMLDPNIKLGSNDIYVGTEEPTGENRPKLWVDPEDVREPLSMELLWENGNIASEFIAQQVYMDLTAYNYVAVAFIRSKGSNVLYDFCMSKLEETIDVRLPMEKIFHYRLAGVHADHVDFTNSQYITYGNTAKTVNNEMLIPARIYGIKGVSA